MGRAQRFLQIGNTTPLIKHPLVELVGQNRVLIENHQGVLAYSTDEIQIKVSYGCVIVKGTKLQLLEMSKMQLVICGRIDSIQLFGGSE